MSQQPTSGIALSGSGAHTGADPARRESGVNPDARDGAEPASKVTITLGGSGSGPRGSSATETVIATARSDVAEGADGSMGAQDLDGIFCLGDTGQDVLANDTMVLLGGESAAPHSTNRANGRIGREEALALQGLAVLRKSSDLANSYIGGTTLTLSNGEQIIVGPTLVR